jgi:predicted RNA-binding Zn-ribbon protein involved in translation (DUF1610 family)
MTDTFPPSGYIPTDSAIEGVEIYKPTPPDVAHDKVVDFECPQCGASTAYSIADGSLTCTHCGYYEAPAKEITGKSAQAFEFKLETLDRAAQGWGETRNELACQNCGARISYPSNALTHTCPFCASNKVIQRAAPQDVLRPRFLIPFVVQSEECRKFARQWLGSSWMTPKRLQNVARLATFTPIYLPFWTFDAVTEATWRAQVGHTETERYYDHHHKSWKTRTKTVWKWETGQAQKNFDDLLILGTARLSKNLLQKINQFNLGDLVAYDAKFLAGLQAQAYDVLLEDAWEQARQTMRETTRQACREQASTPQIRTFSMNLIFNDENWRYILLPIFVAAYSFQKESYQVFINGQTGEIAGQRPADWPKIWLVAAASLAPGLLLSLIGLLTLLVGGVGAVIGGLGLILLLIGLGVAIYLVRKGQQLDDI